RYDSHPLTSGDTAALHFYTYCRLRDMYSFPTRRSSDLVYVSDGKEKEEFEDYVGENYSQIEKLLEEAGYKEIIYYEKTSDAPEGDRKSTRLNSTRGHLVCRLLLEEKNSRIGTLTP